MQDSIKTVIKPMGISKSILYFGIPAVIFYFFIYFVMQRLHTSGVNDFVNFYVSLVTPLMLLLIASLVAYKFEGNKFNWSSF
jgi:lipopolysaccharide export LptBFGC system permease protein LptF